MESFKKTVRLGTNPEYFRGSVFCKIKFTDGKLSIQGVEGPRLGGNCAGACGQIGSHMDAAYIAGMNFAPGWNADLMTKFVAVWNAWHLNDMQPGTPAQMAYLKTQKWGGTGDHYIWACTVLKEAGLNPDNSLEVLARSSKFPPVGYVYGSAWLKVDVPVDVLEFLKGLPDTDATPAWV
jgi:hypothetical protein